MTVNLNKVTFFSGGHCLQNERFAGLSSWRFCKFHALFLYIEHPEHGGSLIDTGYSEHFFRATRKFPQRLYRWITPVRLNVQGDPSQILEQAGIQQNKLQRIFISHFHADHIGGLKCFPDADFVYRHEPYKQLLNESVSKQVGHGYLHDLVPDDFFERALPVEEAQFQQTADEVAPFKVFDYWGDGSLLLVDLPGHADGQTGFILRTEEKRYFYIIDSCWNMQVMLQEKRLPALSRSFQYDDIAYNTTQKHLRKIAQNSNLEMFACHCPKSLKNLSTE